MTKTVKAGAAQNSNAHLELVAFNYKLTENKLYLFRDYRNLDTWKLTKGSRAIFPVFNKDEDAFKNFFEDAKVTLDFKAPEDKNQVLYGYDWAITLLKAKGFIGEALPKETKKATN